MKEKGIDELFYAIDKLKAEGENFVLDLVGFYEDEYKEQVDLLTDRGIAEFHGFQEEVQKFYETADCVVLASYHEGMSNVLLEAAATGRPIITSDIAGCREAVNDEKNGMLVPVKDGDALYEAMKKMLMLSQGQRKQMGLCGREFMQEVFDKKRVVEKTIKHMLK